jgi:hypothetical protein
VVRPGGIVTGMVTHPGSMRTVVDPEAE